MRTQYRAMMDMSTPTVDGHSLDGEACATPHELAIWLRGTDCGELSEDVVGDLVAFKVDGSFLLGLTDEELADIVPSEAHRMQILHGVQRLRRRFPYDTGFTTAQLAMAKAASDAVLDLLDLQPEHSILTPHRAEKRPRATSRKVRRGLLGTLGSRWRSRLGVGVGLPCN